MGRFFGGSSRLISVSMGSGLNFAMRETSLEK